MLKNQEILLFYFNNLYLYVQNYHIFNNDINKNSKNL